MMGWLALTDPLFYAALKGAAQARHEMPVTPIGWFWKLSLGLNGDDWLIDLVYPL